MTVMPLKWVLEHNRKLWSNKGNHEGKANKSKKVK